MKFLVSTHFLALLMLFSCAAGKSKIETESNPSQEGLVSPQQTGLAQIKILNDGQTLGPIKKGERIEGAIEILNDSDQPLKIDLASACICTEMDWPRTPIKPGERAALTFVYDSAKKEEPVEGIIDEIAVDIVANIPGEVIEAHFTVLFNE